MTQQIFPWNNSLSIKKYDIYWKEDICRSWLFWYYNGSIVHAILIKVLLKLCIDEFILIIKYSFTIHTIEMIKDITLLCVKSIPFLICHNPVVCILIMFQELLTRHVYCDLVFILHIYQTITLIGYILREPLGVITVMVTCKTSHIPYNLLVRPVFPENSWIIFTRIYAESTS